MACNQESVITSAELAGLKQDIQTIDDVVESSLDTTTTKNGKVINTLEGQLKLLGYEPPVTYAASIVFTTNDNTKTIDRSGIIYAPLPSALPFTTTGTWGGDDEDKFFVVQGLTINNIGQYALRNFDTAEDAILSTDLNVGDSVQTLGRKLVGDGGSGLYRVVAAATGTNDGGSFIDSSPSGTFQLQLIDEEPNIIQWGADKTGVADSINEINAANAWAPNVGKMTTPKGDFLVSSTIIWKSDATYEGFGKSSRYYCAVDANINLSQAETISNVSGEYDENITIRNLQLDHNRLTDFTVEVYMSLLLVGSRHIHVDNVHFTNPNTDAIYVNYEYGAVGHVDNQPIDIKIEGCTYTGDNHNRNAISIISGFDIKIIGGNRFIGMTREDMPAAIDLEPNNATNVIEGVIISDAYFDNCKASIGADYVPGNSNTQIRNVEISNIIINDSIPHTTTVPTEFFGHVGIGMAHCRGVSLENINIKDTAHASLWFADIDRLTLNNIQCVAPTSPFICRDCSDVKMSNFYLECTNATVFTSVLTKGILLRYETTGAGHPGVRRAQFSNGTINCTAGTPTNNTAFFGEGNIQDIEVESVFLQGAWANGFVQAQASAGEALRWTVKARIEEGNSMIPYISAFSTATNSGNGEWFIPGVTDGVAEFIAETSKVITVGDFARLATARMTVSAIDDPGTIGLSAKRTSATEFTITASSAYTGDVNWKIVHS